MKNLRSVFFAFTALLLATTAHAQQTNVKASIPFDFVVANQAYPAGEYTVKSLSENGIAIRIDNTQESDKGVALSSACHRLQLFDGTKLVFQRLGDNYFLYQVWTEGSASGREFPMSKAQVQVARNYQKPELLIVAANISH